MIDTERTAKVLSLAGLALVALLFAVWPVAHTISLRDLLLVLVLGVFAYLAVRARPTGWWHGLEWPLGLYVVLTLWLLVVALLISPETAWSLDEIRGQWLKGLFAMLAGGLVALVFARAGRMTACLVIIVGVLLLHTLYVDAVAVKGLVGAWLDPDLRLGSLIRHTGIAPGAEGYNYFTLLRCCEWDIEMLTAGPDKSNYLTNLLIYFLLADIFIRSTYRRRLLPLGNGILAFFFLLALFSFYVEAVRNGVLEIVLVMFVFASLLIYHNRQRLPGKLLLFGALGLVLVPVLIGYVSYRTDPRWQSLRQTIPIALDTTTHKAWLDLNSPVPLLPSGEPVNRSNYMRIARLKGGMELVLDNPAGVGYGRNAFGHAVKQKYGVSSSHSHSGLVDMAIGAGIPGALLWLAFLVGLGALAARGVARRRDDASVLLLFVVTGFGVRMVVDSIIRDHMLQMFLFLAALLAVSVARNLSGARPTPVPAPA